MTDRPRQSQHPLADRSVGWAATLLFLGLALLLTTCTGGLVASPLLPLSPDAELLGQQRTPLEDVMVLLAFLLPICAVFWRAAWVANGSRQGLERRFLSPAMGWFVAVVFGLPSAAATVFALLHGATGGQLALAGCAVVLFCSAPIFAKRLERRTAAAASG